MSRHDIPIVDLDDCAREVAQRLADPAIFDELIYPDDTGVDVAFVWDQNESARDIIEAPDA